MKKLIWMIAYMAILVLPFRAYGQTTIYSDSFESDPVGSHFPVGWTDVGTGSGNGAYSDVQTGTTYTGTYTNLNGSNAVYLYLNGLNGTTATYQGNDFLNSNVGHTFAANTTYTLSYLYGANGGGPTNVSLTANGVVIASSTKTITGGSTAFAAGPTITVDTATNPSLVGQNIGIDFNWTPFTGQYFRSVGLDNIQVTAASDAAPTGISTIGINLAGEWLWTDAIRMAARDFWNPTNNVWNSTAANAVATDSAGWPTLDFAIPLWSAYTTNGDGTYSLVFNGKANAQVIQNYGTITPQNADGTTGNYNSSTNTTTATLTVPVQAVNFGLIFTRTQRTSLSGTNTGLTNIHLYRPTAQGSTTPYPTGSIFTTQTIAMSNKFSTTRFMDQFATNNSLVTNWSDRGLPGFWRQGSQAHPMAYEYAVAYCNATNTDMYVNVPALATDAYITNLAKLIKYGSDGVNPYSSTQLTPVYPPLNPNLHVYLEYSNEVWNGSFAALHQGYTIVQNDQTANNAEWAILNYDNVPNGNLWTGVWRHTALCAMQISNDFRAVYGDSAMPPNANATVRPVLEWQADNGQITGSTGLHFIDSYFNNGDGVAHVTTPHPVPYFFWGGGGATYYDSNNDTASTVDAIFASGIPNTVTTNSGTAYPAAVQMDTQVAKFYGIKRVAYEGGWQICDEARGSIENTPGSPGAAAKYDPRATAAFVGANTIFQQSGGDLNIFYTSSDPDYNFVWGMTYSIANLTVPLYAGVSSIDVTAPAAPTYGNAIAGTGSTTLPYNSQTFWFSSSNIIGDDGMLAWLPLISTPGNYQISMNINSTTAGKTVKVMVDGKVIGGNPINVPVATTAQNVVVATVNLSVGQHGLIIEGQYGSNNNYTGNSGVFTSFVLTKVP